MKKLSIVLVSIMILISSCTFMSNDTVAKVNGKAISSDEIFKYMPQANFESLTASEKEEKINSICDDYLMREYLEEQGDLDSGDVYWEIKVWDIRELANGAYQKLIIDPILTEEALLGLYNKMQYDLDLSHILIGYNNDHNLNDRTKQEALDLVNEIHAKISSDNFSDLANEFSDDRSVKRNQGNLGWAKAGRWIESFENTAYQLKPGEISKPVETEYGFHIIKLNERRENSLEPFETVRFELESLAMESWQSKFINQERKVIDSLQTTNQIVLDDSLLTDFLDRFTRLSQNVFYSEQFTAFDIMDIFDEDMKVGTIGDDNLDKNWIIQYLKMISLKVPPRFTDRKSFDSFIKTNRMGAIFYKSALDLKLDKDQDFQKTKNVYLAKKSAGLFDKLYVYELITPDESSLKSFYEKEKGNLYLIEPRVKVREVLVEDSLTAVEILNQIKDGEDIGFLAEKYSKRNIGKKNKGLIPPFKKNQYGKMSLAAFNMLDGEVAGPFKVGEFYSVIKKENYIPESFRDYNEIRYRLLSDYRNKFMDEKRSEQKEMLRRKYKLKINKKYISDE